MTAIADLAAQVIAAAFARKLAIITAESCTAGSLSTLLADVPGAGDVFLGGFVTYAKSCKTNLLGVSAELLAKETAVSSDVALAMARGALERCRTADISIAVTCVIGPEPDADGNPVGLTHIAVCDRSGGAQHECHRIDDGASGRVRGEALRLALNLLLHRLHALAEPQRA